jgi:DNA polymerase elongation subunit (family B)
MSTKKKLAAGKSFKFFDYQVIDTDLNNSYLSSSSSSSSDEDDKNFSKIKVKKTDNNSFIIQMFGINEYGETCSVFVKDFNPFFYIKVAEDWTQNNANILLIFLRSKLNSYHSLSLLGAELCYNKKLYDFSGDTSFKFVKLYFKTKTAMNRIKNLWYTFSEGSDGRQSSELKSFIYSYIPSLPEPQITKKIRLELYETAIPPLLRFFHIYNISPSGWIYIPTTCFANFEKKTTCTFEYICSANQLKPLHKKEAIVPYKICSFDIEASSSHGEFPLPKKTYKKLAANLIDCFSLHSPSTKEKINIFIKKVVLTAFAYDKFENVDVVYTKTQISKTQLNELINVFIQTPINIEKIKNNDANDTFFEKKIDLFFGGGGGDEDDDAVDTENSLGEIVDNDEEKCVYKKSTVLTTVEPGKEDNIFIQEVLTNISFSREEKIKIIDNAFLYCNFPPIEGDKTTFIGSTFLRYGEKTPYLNHCIALNTCNPVPNAEIVAVSTEKELLIEWKNLIQRENPDIIIGYNIFGFDYEFLFRRAEENNCQIDFLSLSRNINESCGVENFENGKLQLKNTKVNLASGEYDLNYPNIIGRLQIDMLIYMRREFNLSSYKLDNVAGGFICDDIKKIEINENNNTTLLYSSNLSGLNIDDYIHIEITGFTTDYYRNGKKYKVMEIIAAEKIIIIEDCHFDLEKIMKNKSIKWCMAKDDVSPQDIFKLSNGSSDDRAVVAKYCIQDCNLVHHLINKIDVLTGYIEMSNICSVPISFLVFRGQGIKLTSFVAKKCREKGILMPDLNKKGGNDGYEGAVVLPPKCAMYMDNPVACVDYSSLYPSSMISQNYSPDSKVWKKEYDLNGKLIQESGIKDYSGNFIYDNLPGYKYIDIQFDNFKYISKTRSSGAATKAEKTKVGYTICRWAQFPDDKKAIMPSILQELLKARSHTKKLMNVETDPFMKNILDKRQLGYKVTANSLYGQCGAKTSTFYEKDVAASTTATGRMMIMYAKKMIEDVYGNLRYTTKTHGEVQCRAEYVYGDTDSVFMTFNLERTNGEKIRGKEALEITIEIAQDAAELCTKWLKPPMELSYEKTLMPFILLSKKRYVGMLYETNPNKGKLKYMGLSLKRRDSCDYLKDTYGEILNILMKEQNVSCAIQYLNKSMENLINGHVKMEKLTITKSLRSDYKNPNQIAHKVLANRIGERDPGNKPKSGDRIKFVHFINSSSVSTLQGDKIETPEFILQNKLKIDYAFYITNQLMKPLQQLFGLAIEDIYTILNKKGGLIEYKKSIQNLEKNAATMTTEEYEKFIKDREKISSSRVKILLFDNFLNKINNKKNETKEITSFFSK